MNKELIKKRFSKNLDTYNDNASIQKRMAEHLISFLDKRKFPGILEIGCGTGVLTELAFKNLEFETYTANDIVDECEKFIKKISAKIDFVPSDIEIFLKNNQKKYDLIISNAVFQWIENYEEFINLVLSKLNRGGILLFSTFGVKNFYEIKKVLAQTLPYRTVDDYEKLLKNTNHIIEEEIQTMRFKTPKDVLKHIKLTGANAICETKWTKTDMLNFETKYNELCLSSPVLTYNPVYIQIYKDENRTGG